MASPNLINFDGDNLIITLPFGVRNISVQEDIYSDWKVWAQLPENLKYPPAFRSIGGDPLSPGINAGAYYFLRNDFGWRIRPAEESATTFIEGNLAPQDSTAGIFLPTIGAFTHAVLGLQPITQNVSDLLTFAQEAQYNATVYVDTDHATTGTLYPFGTPNSPVNNLNDAFTILAARDYHHINFRGSATLPQPPGNILFEGDGSFAFIDINGQDITGTHFHGLTINGTVGAPASPLGAMPMLMRCRITQPITNFWGIVMESKILSTILIGANAMIKVYDCQSGVAGAAPGCIIDGQNLPGQNIVFRGWDGGARFQNFGASPGVVMSMGVNSGKITIDSSVTNVSDFSLRGIAELVNNSALPEGAGKTINTAALLQGIDLEKVRKILQNKTHTDPDTGIMTVFDDDGTTFLQADLFEDIAGAQPYRGRGADRRERLT